MLTLLRINWDLWLDGPHADNAKRSCEKWQAHRLDLFKRYTLPSLQAQTEGRWQAWLRCDPDMARLHGPLGELADTDGRLQIVYDSDAAARDLSAERHGERIIFGRIDSDDMLHPQAIERWLDENRPAGDYLQFGDGWAIDLEGGRVFEWNHFSPAVLARVCMASDFSTGMPNQGGNHGKVHEFATRIDDDRYYMIVLHGDNLCNKVRCRWVGAEVLGEAKESVLATFGLKAFSGPAVRLSPAGAAPKGLSPAAGSGL